MALLYLEQAAGALPRVVDGSDAEALHDLRVALRRLRSCLRAFEEELAGSVPRKLGRRLRRLARATGPGRDTEVQIGWLRGCSRELTRHQRAGLAWLIARLERRLEKAYGKLRSELAGEFPALEQGLRRSLSVYRAEVHLDAPRLTTFAATAAALLASQMAKLEHDLARIGAAGDEEEAHRARISAKRLRYLLDPLVKELPGAAPLVRHVKVLQDLLGELHDAHVLEEELAQALEKAAAQRARRLFELSLAPDSDPRQLRTERRRAVEAGILAAARLNRARRDRLFAQLEEGWLGGRAAEFWAAARQLEEALRSAAPEPHPLV
ncbi:MAG TPA: CHAD domain-containing protein [Thermoanaerobaculia bacterium]|nr:CHAD domain-containing protein [Thermoanaerobaculia bacterium]